MTLLIVSGGDDFRLLSAPHPTRSDLGIQMHVDFILKHDRLACRQRPQQTAEFSQFGLPLRIFQTQDRTGPAPGEVLSMQSAADRFGTDTHLLLFPQHQRQQSARPTTPKIAKVPWRLVGQPTHHTQQPSGYERSSNTFPAILADFANTFKSISRIAIGTFIQSRSRISSNRFRNSSHVG